MQIFVDGKIIHFVRKRFLAINLLMNGISRMSGIVRENFGRPTRRSQENTLLLQLVKRLHQCSDKGGLSCPCIALQKEQTLHFPRKKELS